MKSKHLWGRLALLSAALIWGVSFFVMKDAVAGIPVFLLLAIRFTVGFGLLSLIFWKKLIRLTRRGIVRGAICGVLLFSAYTVQTFGLTFTTAGKNAFLTAVYCVLVPFVGWLLFRLKPTRWNWLAAALCLAGIGFVSLEGDLSINIGDALTLVGGLFFALHVVAVSRFGKTEDAVTLTQVQFGTAALCCWLMTLTTEQPPEVWPDNAWVELTYLAVFATTAALLLQNVGQAVTPAAPAAILLSLESVFGVLFSVLFGGEVVTLKLMCGFLLIFVAVIVSETECSFLRGRHVRSFADGAER